MTIRDIAPRTSERLYDHLQATEEGAAERARLIVRLTHPDLPEREVRRKVVALWLRTRNEYLAALKRVSTELGEPTRSSPLEQIKGLTAILNEHGEQTGGNFGPAF